ncbi:pseudouridine synthase [Oceanobacillus chungangensis]|uniref:Pseudouridine synthase n=1 Tax=Oceanobacillus chungangensis TaxID=1229152 RepID=A0A3D8PIJ5_9BACI|nr:pseudouridine synthase [Oceanobacillus chungangensis]RDW15916.1 16S rRNA pseudouridine(516) synthase [Oceanobacillus chungangensis]
MRLDKLLANMGYGSRKDVKALMKKKLVTVNNAIVKDGSIHVSPDADIIKVNESIVTYKKYIYLLMNKPQGVISATTDARDKTVIDLLANDVKHFNPFPVGRLDKDTEGLLLITNDGDLAHQLVSPTKNVGKTYFARIQGKVTEEDVEKFRNGIILEDGYQAKPAELTILNSEEVSEIEVTVTEGKYHQVKRMFEAVDKKVIYLQRLSMGPLELDRSLALGSYRELNEEELAYCLSLK